MAKHSKYQEKIIKNYYQNRQAISLQRLQELVTELYLSEGKKRQKHWQSIVGHLQKMGIKKQQIDHLLQQDNPELLANLVKSIMDKQ